MSYRRYAWIGLMLVCAAGCQRTMTVDVSVTADPNAGLTNTGQFAVSHEAGSPDALERLRKVVSGALQQFMAQNRMLPSDQQKPLDDSSTDADLLKELSIMLRTRMSQAGYTLDERDPGMLVSVEFVTGPYRYKAPAQIVPTAGVDPSIEVGSERFYAAQPAIADAGIVEPARETAVYAHAISIEVSRPAKPHSPVWRGMIVTLGPVNFRQVSPLLVEELLSEFPTPSDKPQRRQIAVPKSVK
jgi:hypothetical protein